LLSLSLSRSSEHKELFLNGLGRRQDLGGVVTGVVLFVVKVEGKGEGEAFEVEVELEAMALSTPSR
jgi:hypothetical protein